MTTGRQPRGIACPGLQPLRISASRVAALEQYILKQYLPAAYGEIYAIQNRATRLSSARLWMHVLMRCLVHKSASQTLEPPLKVSGALYPVSPLDDIDPELDTRLAGLRAAWSLVVKARVDARLHPAMEFARVFRVRRELSGSGWLRSGVAALWHALLMRSKWKAVRDPLTDQVDEIQDEPLAMRGCVNRGDRITARQSSPSLACVGAPWMQEMLSFEDVAAPDATGCAADTVLLCVDGYDDIQRCREVMSRFSGERRTIVWVLSPVSINRLQGLGAVNVLCAADRETRTKVESILERRDVHLLPPSVQPVLHNPIGWWNGELGVRGRKEHAARIPVRWKAMFDLARGRDVKMGVLADLDEMINLSLPQPKALAWRDPEMVSSWHRSRMLRWVFREHTLAHRLGRLGVLSGKDPKRYSNPLISVLLCTNRPDNLQFALDNVVNQRYRPLELVLVLHGSKMPTGQLKSCLDDCDVEVQIHEASSKLSLGECLQLATDHSHGDIVAKFDDDDWYTPSHLESMVQALVFSQAGIAGRRTEFYRFADKEGLFLRRPGAEYIYPLRVRGGTIVARREIFETVSWRPRRRGEDTALCWDCFRNGIPIISGDRFGTVVHRGRSTDHSWRAGQASLQSQSRKLDASVQFKDVLLDEI